MGYLLLVYQLVFQSGRLLQQGVLAQQGVLDLSQFDLQPSKLMDIEGECEFYWKQLLSPDDFSGNEKPIPTGYFNLPGVWNGYMVDGKPLDGMGYATFRLLIKVPKDGRYGIKVKEFDCAYRMWGNGEEVAVGNVGTDKMSMVPSWKRSELFFTSINKEVELIFQISNFHHRKGGPEDMMLFGESNQILDHKKTQQAISYFLIGVMLIMGFHYWGLYLFMRIDKSALNFCLINVVILLRLATTNEKVFADLFHFIDWQIQIRIEYLAYMWTLPLFYGFFRSLYPTLFSLVLYRFSLWATVITSVAVIVLPIKVFTYTPWFFQVLIMLYTFYFLVKMIVATLKRYEDAFVILNGYFFVFLVALNDFLYYNNWINTDFYLPLGLFIMVFTQSLVLSRRYAASFIAKEALAKELELNNAALDNTVTKRTAEIVAQKDEIEKQAISLHQANQRLEELDVFKEKMTHMIVHDIKNPLNTIIGLAAANDIPEKDQYIEQAGSDILNLVENMLDVAKFQQAGIDLQQTDLLLSDIAQNAMEQCRFLALQRDVVFKMEMNGATTVRSNAKMLERVLVNLIGNAVKFSPTRGYVRIVAKPYGDGLVQVSIIDEGPGILPQWHQSIFVEYFTQSAFMGGIKSTGLGLAFCKLVVEAHGCNIWVNAHRMDGAEICFTLPMGASVPVSISSVSDTDATPGDAVSTLGIDDEWRQAFVSVKVYEIGKINQIVSRMVHCGIPANHPWLMSLNNAVTQCDEQQYQQLIFEQNNHAV